MRARIRSVLFAVLTGLLLIAGFPAFADEADLHRYELPNLDTLELVVPPGWVDSVDAPPGGAPLTIQFRPALGTPFEIHITPEWTETGREMRDVLTLREMVRDAAARIEPQSVEPSLEIRRLQGSDGAGFYFVATDRAPQPEEYKYMAQGAMQSGQLVLWFTILTNDGQEAIVADALGLLQAAVHRGTGLDQR